MYSGKPNMAQRLRDQHCLTHCQPSSLTLTSSSSQLTFFVLKARECRWPELEAALIERQIRYDRHPDSGNTTGDMLRYKATEFWGSSHNTLANPAQNGQMDGLQTSRKDII
jgi:hypothetical protein